MADRITVTIRVERGEDHAGIRQVNLDAFGRESEARLVEALRASEAFVPELSLVAVLGQRVVGHILFTRVRIVERDGSRPALALAPMAVLPELQRHGIGSALVWHGLTEARRLGHKVVVVVGHPDYYSRFGFEPAHARGIRAPFEVPQEAFRVLGLAQGALDGVAGEVEYPPPFKGL